MRVHHAKMVYSLVSVDEGVWLDRPAQMVEYLHSAFERNPMQEAFFCIHLDRKNHPLGRHLITLGTATETLVSPRDVFRGAILADAVGLCPAHNHASGDPAPNSADIQVTRALRDTAKNLPSSATPNQTLKVADSSPFGKPATCKTKALLGPFSRPSSNPKKHSASSRNVSESRGNYCHFHCHLGHFSQQ